MGTDTYGPIRRSLNIATPRMMRLVVTLLELGLVTLLAYQLVVLFYKFVEEDTQITPQLEHTVVTDAEVVGDHSLLTSFDPFFRQISATPIAPGGEIAPESNLQIELFGLRAMGNGQGTAIVKMQDGDQKLVHVGDDVANGVKLSGVYADRLEINRSGIRETVFLRPQSARRSATGSGTMPVTADMRPVTNIAVADMLSNLKLSPVRRARRIVGFRLPANIPSALQLAGIEAEDILLTVNGLPLTSHERLQELAEETVGADQLNIEVERRGEKRQTILRLKGTN
ncbi:MAG: type II secretion system protein N [Kordiimonas sp.]